MSLASGLIALDSYFKEGDARKERQYMQAKREAELSVLGDKTEAERSGYQLRAGQNQQGLELLPGETANKRTQQGLDTADLAGRAERQPDEIATAKAKAQSARTLAEFDAKDLPAVIAGKLRDRAISEAEAGTAVLIKLSDLIRTGDKTGIITFMNSMNEINPPEKRKPPVANVGVTAGPNGEKIFVAQDASGNTLFQMSSAQMQQLRDAVGKTEYKTVNAGDTLVSVKDGKATPVYTAPESEKSRAAKSGPLERDVTYLTTVHKMTQQQALAHLNSAKTMSREQFILKSVQDKVAMGEKPSDKDVQELGALYDRARGSASAGLANTPAQGSNTAPAATIDPEIKSLLGLP